MESIDIFNSLKCELSLIKSRATSSDCAYVQLLEAEVSRSRGMIRKRGDTVTANPSRGLAKVRRSAAGATQIEKKLATAWLPFSCPVRRGGRK